MTNENYTLNIKVNKSIDLDDMPYSREQKLEIAFLIWQINKHVEYTLFAEKICQLMDIADIDLDEYLDYLVDENIIRVAAVTSKGFKVYMMVAPYTMAKKDCWNLCFSYEGDSTPTFMSKFIADGYSYKNPSGYIPGLPMTDYPKPVSAAERIKDERIKELETELAKTKNAFMNLMDNGNVMIEYCQN